ncbi:MAG: methyltransferase domain-containing protein [Elusimicrobia bacterium]|nr:methyltransferase domain-containing protein [Elusimicrobiota bacterium]
MKQTRASPSPSPEADLGTIVKLMTAYRGARVLTSAVELGVFQTLSRKSLRAGEVAQKLNAKTRPTAILMNALTALGFLRKKGEFYANAAVAQNHLIQQAKGSLVSNLRYQELLAHAWADLPEVVKRGYPRRALNGLLSRDPRFVRDYIKGMADIAERPARELAAQLDLSSVHRILDVGGGPGTYCRALLEREPHLRAVLLDLAPTLKLTSKLWAGSPMRDRARFKAANYHAASFGREKFDLILFSHITHDEGEDENRALTAKAFAALRPGGQLVIHDFMLEPDHAGPLFPALFAVHMLVYTRKGRVYSAGEYESWLREAGFRGPRRLDICPASANASKAIVAVKP